MLVLYREEKQFQSVYVRCRLEIVAGFREYLGKGSFGPIRTFWFPIREPIRLVQKSLWFLQFFLT